MDWIDVKDPRQPGENAVVANPSIGELGRNSLGFLPDSGYDAGPDRRSPPSLEPARSPIVGRRARTVAADLWHNRELVMRYERITLQPDQMGGQPCIRSLRIPVATVVAMVADGMTHDEILAAYPDLERDDIGEALRYAAEAVRERELPLKTVA
jgi:uncharacterized protein (DUF433 family)